jgi:hypothetical protein
MQVAVAGGNPDPVVTGQNLHGSPLPEPAQHEHGVGEHPEGPASSAGPAVYPFREQQTSNVLGERARHIQGGRNM